MSEEIIALLIVSLLACIASFGFGYFFCKSRGAGLAGNTELCSDIQTGVADSQKRVGDIIDTASDIEAIFDKYNKRTEQDSKPEQLAEN